ncbi:MAG TPA: transaldolase [Elusimicrobia bacterium]|nr:MAG: transaldolase [Elusimicrobia bacterium GWD2_63_28]HCC49058.1 transaldolase [Elusimicrobiota bacterium]
MLSAEEVRKTGQSLWLDDLSRDLLFSGALGRYIADRAVTGLTSNPSIFEKALAGEYYAAPMKELAALETPAGEIFEVLAVEDIQRAADMLLPAFDAAGGLDGFVSMEVSPRLAFDAARTESEGLRLAARIGRPNLMIKVPATKEGLLAGENLLKAGVSVNFTLIFSVDRYRAVTQAYTAALSWRARNGLPAGSVASVASFFVSRIDTAVDKALKDLPGGAGLPGRAGIANSLLAYRLYRELFYCPGFKASGLPPQRILWASTSVKDPAYRPSLYMEQLALGGSVNTAPGEALEAYFADGQPDRAPLEARYAAAEAHFAELKKLGIDFPAILRDLEKDGIEKFARSHDGLLARIERERQAALNPAAPDWAPAGAEQAFQALAALNFPARFWKKDTTLWSGAGEKKQAAAALAWPDAPFKLLPKAKEIVKFASEIVEEGFTSVVLLGAGGPALAAEALRGAFQNPRFPRLFVTDTDNPAWLEAVRAQLDLKRTLFVCAWDGACAGPEARQKYFWSLVKKAGVKEPGRNFIAITAPDAPLEKLAHLKKFRRVFTDAAGAGGFSALSWAALLPAALCGADVNRLLERAIDLASQTRETDISKNPGCALGALLARYAAAGRDKLTLQAPVRLRQFAAWAEHLLAGSLGPGGVIPVSGEQLMEPDKYQADRFFVRLRLQGFDDPAEDKALEALARAGHPVYTITLRDTCDLGGEFFRWQTAAAAAGALLGLNPFAPWAADCESLAALAKTGKLPAPKPDFSSERMAVYASPALKAAGGIAGYDDVFWSVFSTLGEKEYISLLAYLPPEAKVESALARLRGTLARYTSSACALSWGSRCLYSAGRLHREGPDKGVFVILTSQARKDILVPGEKYTFWQLETAQAGGDFDALVSKGRRVLRLHLKHPLDKSLAYIAERIARLGKTERESAIASEESEMLKLAVKKTTKTTNKTTTPATKIVNTNEYVVVDFPKNLENITSRHYSVRIGASDCTGVDISINDQPWQPCRHAAGYWWFDWNNYQPGTHQLVARMHKRNGEYLISKRRRCKAA